jgi:hypothetical protein
MTDAPKKRSMLAHVRRAVIEIAFIVFLFYANLLMGDFTETRHIKSFAVAFRDIVTPTNFGIAVFSAVVGYIVFEYLRKKL